MKNYKPLKTLLLLSFLFLLTVTTFAQVDVARQTTAITYPQDEVVNVQFRGTTRFPRMKGEARLKRTAKNGTEIDLSVSKMPRPFELGAGYATYVLWAISPDGQIDNLGEIKRRGFFDFDSKISVTTPLQTFALVISAEPHFLVRRPSQTIMLENLSPFAPSGRTLATTKAIQYFGNSSDFFRDARTPEIAEVDYAKTPSTILQAKQAVALARFAGAQRDADEELLQAETLLLNADNAWRAGRDEEIVDISARQAISAAVKAETTAAIRKEAREKRNEKTRADAEVRQSEEKFSDAQTEIADLKSELARETRNRELAERDAQNFSNQIRELRDELGRAREELGKNKTEVETIKAKLASIESQNQEIERQRAEQLEREQRQNQIQANMPTLIQSLRRFGVVKQDERGIILTLPETYFAGTRASDLAANGETNVNSLGEILASSADFKILIESHTDNRGAPEELQTLTERRAQTIAEKMASLGVAQNRLELKGYGANLPVAANTTNASRGKNRRVQIILSPIE
ncbi:MAG TPA: OmpA family protein [Pyrinomonadaceae bacterium]|nr:OmpA family protein [Pyrinomonadaceae bacterium]